MGKCMANFASKINFQNLKCEIFYVEHNTVYRKCVKLLSILLCTDHILRNYDLQILLV